MSKPDEEPVIVDDTQVQSRLKWAPIAHFTLLELVVVVAIVSLLIAIFLPSIGSHPQSLCTACTANLGSIGRACLTYAEDNDLVLPSSLDVLLEGGSQAYLVPQQVVCPKTKVAYIYIPGQCLTDDPRNVLAYEPLGQHKSEGANVAFLDGHAEWCTPDRLQEVLANTKAKLAQAATQSAD